MPHLNHGSALVTLCLYITIYRYNKECAEGTFQGVQSNLWSGQDKSSQGTNVYENTCIEWQCLYDMYSVHI